MTFRPLLWLLAFSLATPAVYGDPVYVIEQLVVSVESAPGAEGERIGEVKSGDKLELLDHDGDEAHVRLPSGQEGWIKASYLTAEPPLQQRLTERTGELDKLKQEDEKLKQDVKRLESQLATARSTPNAAPATATSGGASTSARASPAATATSPVVTPASPAVSSPPTASSSPTAGSPPAPIRETVFLRSPDRPGQTPWAFLLGISAVMLLVGFMLGWKTLDRRIRQKYGGLRIY